MAATVLSFGVVTVALASDLERAVDSVVEPYLRTGNFSGVVIAADGEELLVAKAYGMAQIELDVANDLNTVFHLASSSKPFTTAAILLLEQDGKLAVDDPLSKFVPGFPRGDRISLHHLMINSTGIPNINGLPGYDDLARRRQTPQSLIEAFRDLPPEFEPGARYGYSNSNYNLLALVIERLSELSFGEFLEHRIFSPLGMESSGHHADAARIIPRRAEGYSPVGLAALERAPWLDWSVKTGNGSLYSTAPDLLRFARAISTGGLLSPESVRRMHTAHIGSSGYGWFVRPRHGRPQVHINGRSPGFTSYMGLYPEDDLIVIVLGNVYNSMADPIGEAVAGLALGLEVEPPAFTKRPIAAEVASRIAGHYRFDKTYYAPNWEIEVVAEDGYLFANGDWLMPHPESDTTFTHRRYTSLLEFETLENGRYQSVVSDDFVGKRVSD
jgi:CubicO group peptidase (beta-lactamase class C family)